MPFELVLISILFHPFFFSYLRLRFHFFFKFSKYVTPRFKRKKKNIIGFPGYYLGPLNVKVGKWLHP